MPASDWRRCLRPGAIALAGLALPVLAACAGGGGEVDGSKLVPKDYRGCVAGGGRLDHPERGGACHLQISERRNPTAYTYCLSIGGTDRAIGSVAGLRTAAGGARGRICTLSYEKGPSRQRLDANVE